MDDHDDQRRATFELASQALGALPILGHFLDRWLEHVLERHLPDDDQRV